MTRHSLMPGETDLGKYVSGQRELTSVRKAYLKKTLSIFDSGKKPLNVEVLPIQQLRIEREGYRVIDSSFLSMSNTIRINNQDIHVPRFGVYGKIVDGFDDLSVKFGLRYGINPFVPESYLVSAGRNIPDKLLNSLLRATETGKNGVLQPDGRGDYTAIGLPRDIKKKLRKIGNTEVTARFRGLIPQETRSKLEIAGGIFRSGVYLIAEVKPEEWTEVQIKADPILAGLGLDNNLYLIDHFSTTPMEKYARKEFTS